MALHEHYFGKDSKQSKFVLHIWLQASLIWHLAILFRMAAAQEEPAQAPITTVGDDDDDVVELVEGKNSMKAVIAEMVDFT